MQHPRFCEGALTTGFIAEEYPEGFVGAPAGPELLRQLAAIGAFAGTAQADRARRIDGQLGKRLRPASAWQVKIADVVHRSEEHTSELQSLMRISYAAFCLKTKKKNFNAYF